jgi:hypothetical protein
MDFIDNNKYSSESQVNCEDSASNDLHSKFSSCCFTEADLIEDEDDDNIINQTVTEKTEDEIELNVIENDLEDWIDDEEDDKLLIKSLFDDSHFPSVESLLHYDSEVYKFDLRQIIHDQFHDDISIIKLINFIRFKVLSLEKSSISDVFIAEIIRSVGTNEFLSDDTYMKPVLEDDPLLYLYEDNLITMDDD